jgi:tungstate transport system ATP-binding protein
MSDNFSAATSIMLTLENVGYQVDGQWLLQGLSNELYELKRTILLGQNGAGKSLFLRLCHNLIEPSIGRLKWANGQPPRQTMVMQHPIMLRCSVQKNMALALYSQRKNLTTHQIDQAIIEALDWAGMVDYLEHPAHLLSQGLQQRLAIARAWAFRPELLFLDEPTASLDPESTELVETMINDLTLCGVKIVMSTHNLAQARRLADDVIFIHGGKVLHHQNAETFFTNPQSKQAADYIRLES